MSGETVLVGRDAELDRLGVWVDRVASGVGKAVLIEGEPGIGKSTVARAAAELAEKQGCQVYWAVADELGQSLPLRPLLTALQRNDSVASRLTTVWRLLRGELGGGDPTVAAAEQLLTHMTELCSVAPTMLVVDDLQWADPATVAVWEWLARSVDRSALLLVGIVRPVPHRAELAAVRRQVGDEGIVRLDRLPDTAVASLLARLTAGTPGADLVELADEAAGNPLYLTELVAALDRANQLTRTEAGTVEVAGDPVPDSLIGRITDRLDFLPWDVRAVLQAATLLGVEFLVSDLAIVLNRRVADVVPSIELARTANVLKASGDKLSFRHPLIRTALYEGIAGALRPAWHMDAAKALAMAGAPVDRVAPQLLEAAGTSVAGPLDAELLTWLADAAPTLLAQAPTKAVDLLRQAAQCAPPNTRRGAVLTARLADALYRTGDTKAAEHAAARAMVLVTDPDVLVDLHGTLANCRSVDGRAAESLTSLRAALDLPGISTRHRARLLTLIARAHRGLGEVAVAGKVGERALAMAEEAGDSSAVGWAFHVLIIVSMMRGDVESALPLFERALTVVRDDPELTDLGLLLRVNHAVALGDLDRYDEALVAAGRVRALADHSGSLVRLAQAQSALGELLFEVGRWDDALAEVETLPDDFKDPGVTCCDRGVAAVVAFRRGDVGTGRRHLAAAAGSAEQIGNRVVATLTLARALDHEIARRPDDALAVLMHSADAEELDEMEELLPVAARLAAGTGAAGVADDVVGQAERLARRSRVPHRLAAADYCRGMRDGDPALLLAAAEQYEAARRPLLVAEALEAAGDRLAGRGERTEARAALLRADEVYGELGADWDRSRLGAVLRRHGFRRGTRRRQRPETGWDSLSPTERQVAELVGASMSNREIAERLTLSTRTIDTHVSHILAKLTVRSRVDIARAVDRRGPHSL
jgi:DNA-binding CsgD family transcriptional regulator/tetratricopeptide (TPR) repeat protein